MVDVQAQLGAVSRAVEATEQGGEAATRQSLSQVYRSPVDDVWDAVTSPERIARWFLPISGDLRLGGRYQTEGNAGGEILECEPRSHFRATWEFGGGVSWITVRVTPEGDGTRFTLEHVALDSAVPAEMAEMFGPGATGVGWDGGLLGLSLHLASPDTAMTPEEGVAWTMSPEGKAFNRAAADAWAEAAVAAGADAEVARRQADATYGFYTGQMGMEGEQDPAHHGG
ncbi:SRPBCC family protein [Agrococcus beijingensis]|uniref:SRPBCC family protein n=1 Tax=Agrococcus beijingensis TaxID=3068634 RepID=UPI0027418FBB|nr:SRPBCC family protein [Agrococcus sp. REN33]